MNAKRLLSAILAAAIVLSTMSFTAFATDGDLSGLIDAAGTEETTINLAAETYKMPNVSGKNIILQGTEGTVVEMYNAINASNSTITFNNLTAKFDNDGYEGLQHSTKVVYNNCTIYGTQFLYAPTVEFNGCTFEKYDENTEYNVWTYGAKNVKFNGCTFNTNGKAILVYTEVAHEADISLTNCTFSSTGKYTDKAAVELGQSANGAESKYNLSFEKCSATGFSSNNSTSPLWGNKNSMDSIDADGKGIDVAIDNAPAAPLVMLNDVPYYSLDNAIADAKDGDTITLNGDAKVLKQMELGNITIDLNDNTLKMGDGETDYAYWADNNSAVATFENGTIDLGGIKSSTSVFVHYGNEQSKTVFNDIDFTGDVEYVNYVFSPQNGSMEFNDSDVTLTTDDGYNYVFVASSSDGKFIFDNTNVNVSGFRKAFLNSVLDINGGEIVVTNSKNGMDNVKGEISGTKVTIDGSSEYGLGGDGSEYKLTLKDGAVVEITNSTEYDVSLSGGASIDIYDSKSTLSYDEDKVNLDGTSKINEPRAFVLKIGGALADTEDKAVSVEAGEIIAIDLYIESDAGIKGAEWEINYDKDIFEYAADPKANGIIADNDYQQGTGVYDKNVAVRTYKFKALSLADEKVGKFNVVGKLNSSAGEALDGNIVPSDIIPAYVKIALDTNYDVVVKIDGEVVEKDTTGNYVKEFQYDGSNHIVKVIPEFATPDLVAEKVTYKVNGIEVTTLEDYNFSNEMDYTIEYEVDGPAGYGNIKGTVILKITKPEYVVEVNLNNETIADYVKGDYEAGTKAKKLVLVYTNVDKVSFTYNKMPMLDVTSKGYKYVNHGANNGSGTIPVEYKHVFAYVTDVIFEGDVKAEIKAYEDLVKHASGDKYVKPEYVEPVDEEGNDIYKEFDVNYKNGVEGQDIITGYTVYNNLAEAFSAHQYMKMVLKSDINGDKYINVKDTSAIINAVYPQK